MSSGGKRPGAGAKPKLEKRIHAVYFRLTQKKFEKWMQKPLKERQTILNKAIDENC